MNWYYVDKGQKHGPVTEEELRLRLEARAIDAKTQVCQEDGEWKALSAFPNFSLYLTVLSIDAPPALQNTATTRAVQTSAQPLTLEQLRDPNERTALICLYVFAAPMMLALAFLVVVTLGIPLIFIGLIWIAELLAAAYIKSNGVRVTDQQLPEVYRSVLQCGQRLGIEPPDVFVMQHNIWNAFAAKLAGQRMVVLYSGAIDAILLKGNMSQLTWVVAHEIGHHVAGHLDFLRRLARLGSWAPWILLWYSRRAEFTCDRIALYCTGSLQASLLAVANMTVGAQMANQVNVNAAVEDWERYSREFFVKYRTIYSTHPPNLWRLKQLCLAAAEFGIK